MIDLAAVLVPTDESGSFAIPLPLALATFGLIGTVVGAFINAVSKKWRTPGDDIAEKKINIEADDKLLARFENLLHSRDARIDTLDNKITELREEIEEIRMERNELLDFIYVLVRIVRNADLLEEIPDPPSAVHIAGLTTRSRKQAQNDPRQQ